MTLDEMRIDAAKKSKKGLHFIIGSVIIWCAVLVIWLMPIEDIMTRNLLTFCFTAPLLPISYMISRIIKSEFTIKGNPLNDIGFLFAMNQMLYLLIAMWVYPTVPDKMVMVIALIFGAHLLPFSWLYKSRAYMVMSIGISLTMFVVGNVYGPHIVAGGMVLIEILFCIWLAVENKRLASTIQRQNIIKA